MEKIRLAFSAGIRFQFPDFLSSTKRIPRNSLSLQAAKSLAKSTVEEIIVDLIPRYIPDVLLSLHTRSGNRSFKGNWWVGEDIYSEDTAGRLASFREEGGQWLSCQHGGGYGMFDSFPLGFVEYETSDGFATWGWNSHSHHSSFFPLPSPYLSKLPEYRGGDDRIVFVGTLLPPYVYRFHSLLLPEQQWPYFMNKRKFLLALEQGIQDKIWYRPYWSTEYGTEETDCLQGLIPPSRFLKGRSLAHSFSRARLVVIDHLGTSVLETFAMNVPTLLFWDPHHIVWSQENAGLFEELRRVGVFFPDPAAAADHLNAIWPEPSSWWFSREVQAVIKEFVRVHARRDKEWMKRWTSFFKSLGKQESG